MPRPAAPPRTNRPTMPIALPPLPCEPAAFAPHLATETVMRHRNAQQAGIDALDALLGMEADDPPPLADLARTGSGALAERAAQAWAEEFYWSALRPGDGVQREPRATLADAIGQSFGDLRRLGERFGEAAERLPGTGWLWLVRRRDGRLAILATPRSSTPLTGTDTPLLACCLWPHALPEEQPDARARHLAAFWALVDWAVVATRMQ